MTRTQRQIEEGRKGSASIRVQNADGRPWPGIRVSVEQEAHQFPFACVVPDLAGLTQRDRNRYFARLHEVFNRVVSASQTATLEQDLLLVHATERLHLGTLRSRLDRLGSEGRGLQVVVSGRTVGMSGPAAQGTAPSTSERELGHRVAELYALCFSHRSVCGIVWTGFWDGESDVAGSGLLRCDLAPKHAHKRLHKLLKTVWHTRHRGETDAGGLFSFRGFYGTYRVVVTAGKTPAQITTGSLTRQSRESKPWIVEIPEAAAAREPERGS